MSTIAFDDKGLVVAVAQDRLTGQVRMVAWMNAEAVARTLETGRATFFSRSRGMLWEKGETSGNTLAVSAVYADCDADSLLLLVEPRGPTCHTGRPTCFFRTMAPDGTLSETPREAASFLQELEAEIENRTRQTAAQSYTRSLLDAGASKIGDKIREEAGELSVALAEESVERVASETADLLYHALVGLRLRGVPFSKVIEVLASRAGVSGHVEKARRERPPTPA